jgi:anti-sigma factor RsiW
MMNNEQLQIFLDSHGADPAHWPDAHRAAAERLIASDAQAHAIFARAQRLDTLLTQAHDAGAEDAAAAARVLSRLTALPPQKRPFWHWPLVLLDWQFAPAWPRVAALAGCAAIGFMVGLAGLDRTLDRLDAQSVVASRDIGSMFEPEAITGSRP